MIYSTIKAIDRIISLLEERTKRRRNFFLDQVDPIYHEMEKIHSDYTKSFMELSKEIDERQSKGEIIESVIRKKREYEYLRVKIYSFWSASTKLKDIPEAARDFMHRCFEYFYNQESFVSINAYKGQYTSILMILGELDFQDDLSHAKNELKRLIDEKIDHSELSWQKITHAYANCRLTLLR